MLITENELRRIIRQIILEDHMMNEGIFKNTSSLLLKLLMFLMFKMPNIASAESFTSFCAKKVAEVSNANELNNEQRNELLGLAAKFSDKASDGSTPEEAKEAARQITEFAQKSNVPARAWFAFLKKVSAHIKEKASGSNRSIKLLNSDKNPNLEIIESDGYYYLHDSSDYNFYFKAKKEIFNWLIDPNSDAVKYEMSDPECDDANLLKFIVEDGNTNWMQDEPGHKFPAGIALVRASRNQEKLKNEFKSIK